MWFASLADRLVVPPHWGPQYRVHRGMDAMLMSGCKALLQLPIAIRSIHLVRKYFVSILQLPSAIIMDCLIAIIAPEGWCLWCLLILIGHLHSKSGRTQTAPLPPRLRLHLHHTHASLKTHGRCGGAKQLQLGVHSKHNTFHTSG